MTKSFRMALCQMDDKEKNILKAAGMLEYEGKEKINAVDNIINQVYTLFSD